MDKCCSCGNPFYAQPKPSQAAAIVGLQAQLQNRRGMRTTEIMLDTITFDNSNGAISIADGRTIVLNTAGIYKLDWQITYNDPSLAGKDVQVVLYINDAQHTVSSQVSSSGQITGNTMLEVSAPTRGDFIFRVGQSVILGDTDVQANVTVLKIG